MKKEKNNINEFFSPIVYRCPNCGKYIEGSIPFEIHKREHSYQMSAKNKSAKLKPVKPTPPKVIAAEELKRLLKAKNNQKI